MTAGSGNEPAWAVGETRTFPGKPMLCKQGYHFSPTPWDALQYAPGPVLTLVKVSARKAQGGDKGVAKKRMLLEAVDVSRELRLFACDCAERVLPLFEAEFPDDNRPRQAIETARKFANGEASEAELLVAFDDARATLNVFDAAGLVLGDAWCAPGYSADAARSAAMNDVRGAALGAVGAADAATWASAERGAVMNYVQDAVLDAAYAALSADLRAGELWQRDTFNCRMAEVLGE